jgi:hypothetical protein
VGPITIGAHKKNVSPQNHLHDSTLNDHYVYQIIYLLIIYFSLDIHIIFIKMVVINYDLDDFKVSSSVLKWFPKTMSHYIWRYKRNQKGKNIVIQKESKG